MSIIAKSLLEDLPMPKIAKVFIYCALSLDMTRSRIIALLLIVVLLACMVAIIYIEQRTTVVSAPERER